MVAADIHFVSADKRFAGANAGQIDSGPALVFKIVDDAVCAFAAVVDLNEAVGNVEYHVAL